MGQSTTGRIGPTTHRTMSDRSYHEATSLSPVLRIIQAILRSLLKDSELVVSCEVNDRVEDRVVILNPQTALLAVAGRRMRNQRPPGREREKCFI